MPRAPLSDNSCFGTMRSSKPSPLRSPHIGLPQDLLAIAIMPASVETLRNSWATDTEQRAATNPAVANRPKADRFSPASKRHEAKELKSVLNEREFHIPLRRVREVNRKSSRDMCRCPRRLGSLLLQLSLTLPKERTVDALRTLFIFSYFIGLN